MIVTCEAFGDGFLCRMGSLRIVFGPRGVDVAILDPVRWGRDHDDAKARRKASQARSIAKRAKLELGANGVSPGPSAARH